MKYIFSLLLIGIFAATAFAQNITDVDAYQNGKQVYITYTLDENADITIYLSADGGNTYSAALNNVSGDVGNNVAAGNKTAVWDVLADRDRFVGDNFRFKVKASSDKSNQIFTVGGVRFEMIYVKGGTFTMGCTSEQSDCDDDESPSHRVTLSDYMIGKYEVTIGLFSKFIEATNYRTDAEKVGWCWIWTSRSGKWQWEKENGLNWTCNEKGRVRNLYEYNQPVIHVSWNDAKAFCEWLRQETGQQFRLPTEAEWEFAARGGNKSNGYIYSGSNTLSNVGWYQDNSGNKTHSVGQKMPNELGIYDMSGNVWEWCQDWYGDYNSTSQINPTGPSSGSYRVLRGECWIDIAKKCRISNRGRSTLDNCGSDLGFRVALIP